MAATGFADWLTSQIERADAIGTLAKAWDAGDTGKITSVSGVKRWFDENPGELEPDWLKTTLELAVRDYTAIRQQGTGTGATKALDRMERMEAMLKALESVPERLGGMEQALAWLVDSQAAFMEQQALAARLAAPGDAQDYRSAIGGDSSRSEAEAMGLVSPAPPRSSVPGYEHVIAPQAVPPPVDNSPAQQGTYPQAPDLGEGPDGPVGWVGHPQPPVDSAASYPQAGEQAVSEQIASHSVGPDRARQIREAIEAETRRIQSQSGGSGLESGRVPHVESFRGSDPNGSVYYDPPQEPQGSPAPAYDWRAMAADADYSEGQQE